jgi:putative transposase
LGRHVQTLDDLLRAEKQYETLVSEGASEDFWRHALRQQIYLGDEAFVARVQQRIEPARHCADEIPREQRRKPLELGQFLAMCSTREEALRRAHLEGGMTMSAIAKALDLSVSRVSRLIARFEVSLSRRS